MIHVSPVLSFARGVLERIMAATPYWRSGHRIWSACTFNDCWAGRIRLLWSIVSCFIRHSSLWNCEGKIDASCLKHMAKPLISHRNVIILAMSQSLEATEGVRNQGSDNELYCLQELWLAAHACIGPWPGTRHRPTPHLIKADLEQRQINSTIDDFT